MRMITTLRHKMLPFYVVVFAILLPTLIQAAQAVPVSAGTSGKGDNPQYLVICTGQGIVYAPQSPDSSAPESQTSYGLDFCPVCISFSIAQNTFIPNLPCFLRPDSATGSNLNCVAETRLKIRSQLHHRPRAPPFQFNNKT